MKRWAAIARMGGIGDNLVAGAPLRALKRLGYMTEVLTSEPNHVVYFNNPYIDKLTVKNVERDIANKDHDAWQKWMLGRSREYDVFFHASHSMEQRHAFFKAQTAFYWPQDYRRKMAAGSYLETAFDVIGVPYDFAPLYYPTSEEVRLAAQTTAPLGGRYVCWVISGTRIDKLYPWAPNAIARIIKELGAPVLVLGGPHDRERSSAQTIKEVVGIQNGSRDGLFVAVPDNSGSAAWPLRTSLALAHGAAVVVSPDTGIAWAVALEATAKVLMVSHASAENITKHWVNTTTLHADPERVPCWPCHLLHDDPSTCVQNKEGTGAACISDITTETVVRAVEKAWRGAKILPLAGAARPLVSYALANRGRTADSGRSGTEPDQRGVDRQTP